MYIQYISLNVAFVFLDTFSQLPFENLRCVVPRLDEIVGEIG